METGPEGLAAEAWVACSSLTESYLLAEGGNNPFSDIIRFPRVGGRSLLSSRSTTARPGVEAACHQACHSIQSL